MAPHLPAPTPAPAGDFDAVYFVLVDRFANGDPGNDDSIDLTDPQSFHGGDLAGVLQHLDHIQDMGFRTVWLSPVYAMRTEPFMGHGAFHGYWVLDLGTVEPRFGTEAELRALSDALHARGMRLVATGVPAAEGDEVVLVGTGEALAGWRPEEGLPLTRSGAAWVLEEALPAEWVGEYKLVVRGSDGAMRWQEGENRYVFVTAGDSLVAVDVTW